MGCVIHGEAVWTGLQEISFNSGDGYKVEWKKLILKPRMLPGARTTDGILLAGRFTSPSLPQADIQQANISYLSITLIIIGASGSLIVGGYKVFGKAIKSKLLWSQYIFADFVAKRIDGFLLSGGAVSGSVNHFIPTTFPNSNPISLGEDNYGDLYILLNGDGTVYKLEDTSYLRRPKAYFTPADQGGGSFLFQGLQEEILLYQWLGGYCVKKYQGATSPDYTTSAAGNYTLVVTNTLNFSDTSDVFTLGALPLSLISFTAQKISAGKIRLQWKTDSEQNISGFTILRRQNNEATFSNIGFVEEAKRQNGTQKQ